MLSELFELTSPERMGLAMDGFRCGGSDCAANPEWIASDAEVCDLRCSRHAIAFCAVHRLRQCRRLVVGDAVAARAVETARRREAHGRAARVEGRT